MLEKDLTVRRWHNNSVNMDKNDACKQLQQSLIKVEFNEAEKKWEN